MKNFFFLVVSLALCVACGVTRKATPCENNITNVRVETVYVPDTVIVERPQIIERVVTLDTVSVLDNKYAHSEASVSAGVLTHVLEAKAVKEPVAVKTKIVYRDSLVFKDKVVTEYVDVPAKINGWQRFRMSTGDVVLVLILLALIYLCTKYIHKFLIH